MKWSCSKTRLGHWPMISSLCCCSYHSKVTFSDMVGGVPCNYHSRSVQVSLVSATLQKHGPYRLDINMASFLKSVLPEPTINLWHLFKSLVLKLEHASQLIGSLIKTQVAGLCTQNLFQEIWGGAKNLHFWQIYRWHWWGQAKDHNLRNTALDFKLFFCFEVQWKGNVKL